MNNMEIAAPPPGAADWLRARSPGGPSLQKKEKVRGGAAPTTSERLCSDAEWGKPGIFMGRITYRPYDLLSLVPSQNFIPCCME